MIIIVSTHNRPTATGICLCSVMAGKSAGSELLVMDDHSTEMSGQWFSRFGIKTEPTEEFYMLSKLKRFLKSGHDFLIALDGDVVVNRNFDTAIKNSWHEHRDLGALATGYISRLHQENTIRRFHNYCLLPSTTGFCMAFTRPNAEKMIDGINKLNAWNMSWDLYVPSLFSVVVSTPRSVVQHIGIYEGVHADKNNISPDYSEDFIGDLNIGTP